MSFLGPYMSYRAGANWRRDNSIGSGAPSSRQTGSAGIPLEFLVWIAAMALLGVIALCILALT